jgi:hypothetical protein
MIRDRLLPLGIYRLSYPQKLMLQATLGLGDSAIGAWECWQSLVDIENLDANSNVLLPQLYQNLLAHGIQHPHIARLKGIYRRNWYANKLRLNHLKAILSHLKSGEIEAIVLGKASFCPYQVENYRSVDSFHLLVRSHELEGAVRKLVEIDWQITNSSSKTFIHLQDSQQYSLYIQGHLFWAIPQDYTDAQIWQYAIPDWCDLAGWRLSATDQFLDSCARNFYKGRSPQIDGIADALMLMQKSDLDWIRLITKAQSYQMILPLRNMLTVLQQLLGEIQAPSWVLPALWQMPIASSEWSKYQVLAEDRRSVFISRSKSTLRYLETKLRQIRQLRFPGRQSLKKFLKPIT